ncbi:peptide/nickel transport system substrate-binding protein [Devosia crocina]|uniref:Peptide/nickel transport system substrate-binding protein n=1 Tax=Devosia crocina TaxID=429728 RepID=A0A1I7N283_9HYPH|nr:ABC transporter substrate-binding protein [Devosia crocina]SFV28748.1 peptide/nickel transport system substrate-binding protein [Devosia crocina]
MLIKKLAAAALAIAASVMPAAAQDFIAGIPRNEALIIQGPAAQNAEWFNLWAPGGGASNNGLQQLTADTFWFVNPEGTGDAAWTNALAADRPQYNDDFTEMTVPLKQGIYWSDGVEFTAEDVVYTVETQIANPGMNWSAPFTINVDSVEATDPYTVVFNLKEPNSRFHTLFTVRWNAAWIMPKHVFETVDDPLTYANNPPVSLSAYEMHSYDSAGNWVIWKLREDWERTSIGMDLESEPDVKYVVYRNAGNPDARVIEQMNHNLDVINDIAPEGMFTIARDAGENSAYWFPGYPFAHPDPTLPSVLFNHQNSKFQDKDVRWALALMIDIRAVAMGSYRGAANLAALSVPPTGTAVVDYYEPMQEWLTSFEIDTGARTIAPYDPTVAQQIAALVKPQWGDDIPDDPAQLAAMFGHGWWKQDIEAANELLEKAGLTKNGNQWLLPDGTPFTIRLMVEGDAIPTLARAGTILAQQWSMQGIQTTVDVAGPTNGQRLGAGDFEAAVYWTVETWGGHPDLSFFLESYHSDFIVEPGAVQPPRNLQRWQDERLDAIIEENRTVSFDSPEVVQLGMDYLKLAVEEMPFIPLMAYNKFAPFDTTYWTGYPSAENPYSASGPFWSNTRYMVVNLEANPNAPGAQAAQ